VYRPSRKEDIPPNLEWKRNVAEKIGAKRIMGITNHEGRSGERGTRGRAHQCGPEGISQDILRRDTGRPEGPMEAEWGTAEMGRKIREMGGSGG
jgi:hypothetical protein